MKIEKSENETKNLIEKDEKKFGVTKSETR